MARVLVVEDDPEQLQTRRMLLEHAGHAVKAAQTASEAMSQLADIDIVLMDLRSPTREDGLRLIQAASGKARVIVLTGGPSESVAGVDEFLTKPCSSKKLIETIGRIAESDGHSG